MACPSRWEAYAAHGGRPMSASGPPRTYICLHEDTHSITGISEGQDLCQIQYLVVEVPTIGANQTCPSAFEVLRTLQFE